MTTSPAERYWILQKIGSGATATVFKAIDTLERRTVALKVFNTSKPGPCDSDELSFYPLFEGCSTVAQAEASYTNSQGQQCIVLQYMPHGTLFEYIHPASSVVLTIHQTRRWIRQLVAAAQEFALRGLVHGDIKPENCLISEAGDLVLHDLGTTTRIGHRHGRYIPGTELYMAPELLRSQPCNTPQDVWAIGLVIYAALFADLPWDRASRRDPLFVAYQSAGRLPGKAALELLTPAFHNLLLRMLDPNPQTRASLEQIAAFIDSNAPWFRCQESPAATPSPSFTKLNQTAPKLPTPSSPAPPSPPTKAKGAPRHSMVHKRPSSVHSIAISHRSSPGTSSPGASSLVSSSSLNRFLNTTVL